MALNWRNIIRRLDNYPHGTHQFFPPCGDERLREVQSELGRLPDDVVDMLRHFNGAGLFEKPTWLVTVFGVSTIPSPPEFEWAEDWCIDKYTPRWRAAGEGRQNDWAVAMMSYGVLVIVSGDRRVREWDTAQGIWEPRSFDSFDEWFEEIFREGDIYLREE
jgi:hypothetical protein